VAVAVVAAVGRRVDLLALPILAIALRIGVGRSAQIEGHALASAGLHPTVAFHLLAVVGPASADVVGERPTGFERRGHEAAELAALLGLFALEPDVGVGGHHDVELDACLAFVCTGLAFLLGALGGFGGVLPRHVLGSRRRRSPAVS